MQTFDSDPSPKAVRRARVLLAEDDSELRELIAESLRSAGFEVIELGDGGALVDWLGRSIGPDGSPRGFDLVVSDLRMPVFSALDVLAAMRRFLARTPFILITAFGDARTHERALQLGAAAVLDKPFDLDDLRAALDRVLARG
jgi:DNA-binding response OmpR family regulator